MEGVRLGIIKGYTYYAPLDAYSKANETNTKRIIFSYDTEAMQDLFKKLNRGLVDVIADYENVVLYTA